MFWKGKKLLRRHRIILWVVLVAILIFSVSTYLNNNYTSQKIKTHYLQAFEKKYWAGLDIYQAGSVAVVRDYFNEVYGITTRLTSFEPAVTAVTKNDRAALAKIIDQQHDITRLGSGLFVLDKNGIVIAEKLDSDPLKQLLGTNAASQPYFKNVIETKKPQTSNVYYTLKDGVAAINVCAPYLQNQEIQAIICSTIRLTTLSNQLQEAALKSDYAAFKSVVTDTDGNILFENDKIRAKPINIADDRAVVALIAGADTFRDEEINYDGNKTFVEASHITIGNTGGIFVLSYQLKSEADNQLLLLDATMNRINTGNDSISLLLTLLAVAFVYWIIRKHDEDTTKN